MNDLMVQESIRTLSLAPSCLLMLSSELEILSLSAHFISEQNLDIGRLSGKKLSYAHREGFFPVDVSIDFSQLEKWFEVNFKELDLNESKKAFSGLFKGLCYNILPCSEPELPVILLNFNLTQYKPADTVISERESTFQFMAEDSDILISIVDANGMLEYRNPAWFRFLGDEMPDIGKFRWDAFIHADDLGPFREQLSGAINTQTEFSAEFRMRDQHQKFRWLKIKGTPRLNQHGHFNGYICSGIEISDAKKQLNDLAELNAKLKKSNRNLLESEENLQAAFDAADMGSCSLHIPTGRAEISLRYRQLYGLPLYDELNWEMVMQAVDPAYHDEVNQVLKDAATLGSPVDSTYPIHHLITGEKKWMRVIGKVRRDADGKPESVYAVVIDVTRRIEEELRKNDFIAMVSHELKTPLTSINGYVQLLRHTAIKNEDHRLLPVFDKIQNQLKKMVKMINGFLNVSRLESSELKLTKSQFAISGLINELREEFINDISTHKIEFNCARDFQVYADRDKIGQVINNFLSNAIKYSPVGSLITLQCEAKNNELILSVTDQGMGIKNEDLPKVFDRYYRSEHSKNTTIAGFGIGLYLCSEIIRLHKGKIWAKSLADGSGSEFGFSLKLEA